MPKRTTKVNHRSIKAEADALVRANVHTIAQLEQSAREGRTIPDRIIDMVSAFCGSLAFVYLHAMWFAAWILLNLWPTPGLQFDPFPFGLLTLVVSLEAIFLSTFILITQNRQSRIADRRNHLDLQINLLAEQENTKMLAMLTAIQKKLGIGDVDPEVEVMEQATSPERVVEEIQRCVEEPNAEGEPLGAAEGR
jgi:uncharacterized membrane protein